MGVHARGLTKSVGDPPARILADVSLDIAQGEFVALTGRSGSGKSTLLHILGSLDRASEGTVVVGGRALEGLSPRGLCDFRNRTLGFVFQAHYLLAELSALENVLLPAGKAGETLQRKPHAQDLLARFGLAQAMHRLPRHLSGGERQRVALARALVMDPPFLFADEPTGSLDSANGANVMDILRDCNRRLGTTVVLVTHDPGFAAQADRALHLADGRLVG